MLLHPGGEIADPAHEFADAVKEKDYTQRHSQQRIGSFSMIAHHATSIFLPFLCVVNRTGAAKSLLFGSDARPWLQVTFQ
jgi:hypothetical protein